MKYNEIRQGSSCICHVSDEKFIIKHNKNDSNKYRKYRLAAKKVLKNSDEILRVIGVRAALRLKLIGDSHCKQCIVDQ